MAKKEKTQGKDKDKDKDLAKTKAKAKTKIDKASEDGEDVARHAHAGTDGIDDSHDTIIGPNGKPIITSHACSCGIHHSKSFPCVEHDEDGDETGVPRNAGEKGASHSSHGGPASKSHARARGKLHDVEAFRKEIFESCKRKKLILTKQRRMVLDIVLNEPGIIKPYDVVELYKKETKQSIAATSIYRLLDFWEEAGVLHKVNSLNGYVVCRHTHEKHTPIILVCRKTGRILEVDVPSLWEEVVAIARENDFVIDADNLVLTGEYK